MNNNPKRGNHQPLPDVVCFHVVENGIFQRVFSGSEKIVGFDSMPKDAESLLTRICNFYYEFHYSIQSAQNSFFKSLKKFNAGASMKWLQLS